MTHTVAVGEFEGPLGILLDLVERGRFEVTQISVAEITAGYIERIQALQNLSPEELSEFVTLGARLLYIKSLALLPQDTALEQGEELRRLNLELEEYRHMQLAAAELARRGAKRTWQRPVTPRLELHELPLPSLDLPQIAEAFQRALRRAEPAIETGVIPMRISIETVTAGIKSQLKKGSFELQHLIDSCHDRLEIIVTFLALLELIHDGTARVVQANQFAAISVENAHA